MSDEEEGFFNDQIEIDETLLRFMLRGHASYPVNDLNSTTRIRYDPGREMRVLFDVLIGARQPSQAGLAVGHDGRQRLVDLMRDRGREFAKGRDTSGMREVSL